MKKPNALTQLLEELQNENIRSGVVTLPTSEAVIYINADAVEDENGIKLRAPECKLVFSSTSTVERLLDAIGAEASLALFDLELDHDVLEALERSFTAVDEG